MSSFTTPLRIELLSSGYRWILLEPFEYHVGRYPSADVIEIPRGFITDFSSIPRPFWIAVQPIGRYGKACVVHSYLYTIKTTKRWLADQVFFEAMTVLGVNKALRYLMWFAVRIGGGPGLFREWNYG